jgi:predicted nuclease with TOPRIM domain
MSEAATREELINLEERMTNRQNRIEDKISDICKGQSRMNEKIIKIENTTDNLKTSIDTLSARLSEQTDAIIKEIAYQALTGQGVDVFRKKLQLEIGAAVWWILGIMLTTIIGLAVTICYQST